MKEKDDEDSLYDNNKKSNDGPSSLKNDKFKGMTAEQIINKYESVLLSREKQFFELTQEIGKASHIIQTLKQKKEDYIYNNVLLKDLFSKREQQLKQELSNKEITFMKLTDMEHKCDDLENKIDYIINKQNALADLSMKERERERMNQDKEEGKTLLGKEMQKEKEKENNNKEENKKDENDAIKDSNDSNDNNDIINNNEDGLEKKEEKNNNINIDSNEEKKEIKENIKEIKNTKDAVPEKKENSFLLAKERLNRLKKERNKKIQKLDLSEFLSQSNENNDNNNINNNNNV